jgi:hypothetical protein
MITLPRSCNIYTCGTSGASARRLVGRIVDRNRAYGGVDHPDAHAMLAELETHQMSKDHGSERSGYFTASEADADEPVGPEDE